jgi:hypothetical protein
MLRFSLSELAKYFHEQLRAMEEIRTHGNKEQLQELNLISDDELFRRWLWRIVVIGAPVCFILVPLVLSLLQTFLSSAVTNFFWLSTKCLMLFVFLLFLLASFLSQRNSSVS